MPWASISLHMDHSSNMPYYCEQHQCQLDRDTQCGTRLRPVLLLYFQVISAFKTSSRGYMLRCINYHYNSKGTKRWCFFSVDVHRMH